MGKHFRFLSINAICDNLWEPRSRSLPVFHAFSGCGTTSAFNSIKGKKTAWNAWDVYGDVTDALFYLASHPFETLTVDSDHFQKLERLVIVIRQTSSLNSVNFARQEPT